MKHNLKVMWAKLGRKVAVLGNIEGLITNSAPKAWSFLGFHPAVD